MHKQNNSGFTLIELLVVVLIVGILSAVALPQYTTAVEKSRSAEALTLMDAISNAAQRHRLQKDEWPSSFAYLDVEVPKVADNDYGGKNFKVKMGPLNGASGSKFVIVAERRDLSAAQGKYTLKTILTEGDDGTVTSVRKCGTNTSTTTEDNALGSSDSASTKYCSAITGNKNNNF